MCGEDAQGISVSYRPLEPITYKPQPGTDGVVLTGVIVGTLLMFGLALTAFVYGQGLEDTILTLVLLVAGCMAAFVGVRHAKRMRDPRPTMRIDAKGITIVNSSGESVLIAWADIREVDSRYRYLSKSGHRVLRIAHAKGEALEMPESALGVGAEAVVKDIERFRAAAR